MDASRLESIYFASSIESGDARGFREVSIIFTCEFPVARRRVQHVLRLRDRLKVRHGRRHHLAAVQRQVHHLIVRDEADGHSQDGLRDDSWSEEREKERLITQDATTFTEARPSLIILSLAHPRTNVSRINRYFISIMNVVHASLIQDG